MNSNAQKNTWDEPNEKIILFRICGQQYPRKKKQNKKKPSKNLTEEKKYCEGKNQQKSIPGANTRSPSNNVPGTAQSTLAE